MHKKYRFTLYPFTTVNTPECDELFEPAKEMCIVPRKHFFNISRKSRRNMSLILVIISWPCKSVLTLSWTLHVFKCIFNSGYTEHVFFRQHTVFWISRHFMLVLASLTTVRRSVGADEALLADCKISKETRTIKYSQEIVLTDPLEIRKRTLQNFKKIW